MSQDSDLSISITKIFSTPDGEQVLKALRRRFKENDGLPQHSDGIAIALYMAEQRGAASVVNFIERQIDTQGVTNDRRSKRKRSTK